MTPRKLHRVTRLPVDDAYAGLEGDGDRGVATLIAGSTRPRKAAVVTGHQLVLAPFRFPTASRWSNGSYGVLYAAYDVATALVEHGFHLARFLRDAGWEPRFLARAYVAFDVARRLHDVRSEDPRFSDPDDYAFARERGHALHAAGANGVIYRSARRLEGVCAGIFKPAIVTRPAIVSMVGYRWDGAELVAFRQTEGPIVQ